MITVIEILLANLQPSRPPPSNLTPSPRKTVKLATVVPFRAPATVEFLDAKFESEAASAASVVEVACVGILCDSFDVETPSVLVGGESETDVRDDCVPRCVPFDLSESFQAAML